MSTLGEAWTATVGVGTVTDPVVSATGVFTASSNDVGAVRVTATNLDGSERWAATPQFMTETVSLGDVFVDGERVAVAFYNDMAELSSTAWFAAPTGDLISRPSFGLLQSLNGPWAVSVDWAPIGDPGRVTFVNLDDPTERWGGAWSSGRPSTFSIGRSNAYSSSGINMGVAAYPLGVPISRRSGGLRTGSELAAALPDLGDAGGIAHPGCHLGG